MAKGNWKKRMLSIGLTLSLLGGMFAGMPDGAAVAAGNSVTGPGVSESKVDVNGITGSMTGSLSGNTGLTSAKSSSIPVVSVNDYDTLYQKLTEPGDVCVKLTGDINKTIGKVVQWDEDSEDWSLIVTIDILSLGLAELGLKDKQRPRYVDPQGNNISHLVKMSYWCTLGEGNKVIDLNGYDLKISYPNMYLADSTMFQVNEGTDFTIKDDSNEGEIFYDGYIPAFEDYDFFREHAGGDPQRDLIEINGGSFTLNGGTLTGGRSKNESGLNFFNAYKKENSDSYTGSATKYINATAIELISGEVTINKGTLEGRGYSEINAWHGTTSPHTKNGVIEAKSGKITINDGIINAKGGASCLILDKSVDITVRAGKFSLHRNDALFCGYGTYSNEYYTIDTNQKFGSIGIPERAFGGRAKDYWVEYYTGKNKGKVTADSTEWRTKMSSDAEGKHGEDDYEPGVVIYPDGGWEHLTAVANPTSPIPELNPLVNGQLYFEYDAESIFSFIPLEVRETGGWKREYEFQIFDEKGNQISFTTSSSDKTLKQSFDKDEKNLGYTLKYNPNAYGSDFTNKQFPAGHTFYITCTMTETYYGTRTYSATTVAGRRFVTRDLKAPSIFKAPDDEMNVKKGDEITISASAVYAADAKWYKKTSANAGKEIDSDEYVNEYSKNAAGNAVIKSTLTTTVNEQATYYVVFSNTVGSDKAECKVKYPASFVNTEDSSVTIYKSAGGYLFQPIDGTLASNQFIRWYYQPAGKGDALVADEVSDPNTSTKAFTVFATTLKIARYLTFLSNGVSRFYCQIREINNGVETVIATSPSIFVTYSTASAPDKDITSVYIRGFGMPYKGDKAPTKDNLRVVDSAGNIDPRYYIKSLEFTAGVNSEGIYTGEAPEFTITLELTSDYYQFKNEYGEDDYGNYGNVIFYGIGPGSNYYKGHAKQASATTGYVIIKIKHGKDLTSPLDTLIVGKNYFEFQKGETVDVPIDISIETSDYAKSFGEKHYITKVEEYKTVQTYLPAGLELKKTGTDGNGNAIYRLQGTVTADPTGNYTETASLQVTIGGVPEFPDGRTQYASFKYKILPAKTVTDDEAEEIANEQINENMHQHVMSEWKPDLETSSTYLTHHLRYCTTELDYYEYAPHNWEETCIYQEAVGDEYGLKEYICKDCGQVKYDVYYVNAEGHTVTLDLNLGDAYSNQTKDMDVPAGSFTLPNLQLEHPDGLAFGGWTVKSNDGVIDFGEKAPGESFHVDRNFTCKAIWLTRSLGDVNKDGSIDAADLTALARHVAKIEILTDMQSLVNADVNKDGSIDASDLTALARHVAKIEILPKQ